MAMAMAHLIVCKQPLRDSCIKIKHVTGKLKLIDSRYVTAPWTSVEGGGISPRFRWKLVFIFRTLPFYSGEKENSCRFDKGLVGR